MMILMTSSQTTIQSRAQKQIQRRHKAYGKSIAISDTPELAVYEDGQSVMIIYSGRKYCSNKIRSSMNYLGRKAFLNRDQNVDQWHR